MARKIAIGSLGEFWYGNYKEPFVQLEGGVPGYPQGVILKDDDGRLLCAFCGKVTEHLGNHAVRKHGMKAREYKDEVGLLQKSALVSDRVRQRLMAHGLRMSKNPKNQKAWADLVARRKTHPQAPTFGARNKRRPEALNKTGRCLAQIVAVAQSIAWKDGRLTMRAMKAHGIPQNSMEPYGGYSRIAKLAGVSTSVRTSFTDAELLTMVSDLANKLGYTPGASDLRRYGLPTWHTYRNRFGSWASACERAGLVSTTPVPLDQNGEIAILVAYSVSGSTDKVARQVHRSTVTVCKVLHRYGIPIANNAPPAQREIARRYAAEIARRLTGWGEAA